MSIQKLPSGKYRAVVRRAGERRNGTARAARREAVADEAQIRLEMGAPAAEAEVTVEALLKDQIEQGRYAATALEGSPTSAPNAAGTVPGADGQRGNPVRPQRPVPRADSQGLECASGPARS